MPRKAKSSKSKKPAPTKSSKPTGRKPGAKTLFVLAQDPRLPAGEVVKLASKAGHSLTARRVHNIRWAAKKKGTTAVKATLTPAAKAVKPKITARKAATKKGKTTATKTSKAPKPETKSAFVLGFPPGTSAADVVAAGKAKGITLTTAHVYSIRSGAKAKAKTRGKAVKTPRAPTVKMATGLAFRAAPRAGSGEEQFVGLVLDIGLARATELLGMLKDRVQKLAF